MDFYVEKWKKDSLQLSIVNKSKTTTEIDLILQFIYGKRIARDEKREEKEIDDKSHSNNSINGTTHAHFPIAKT